MGQFTLKILVARLTVGCISHQVAIEPQAPIRDELPFSLNSTRRASTYVRCKVTIVKVNACTVSRNCLTLIGLHYYLVDSFFDYE